MRKSAIIGTVTTLSFSVLTAVYGIVVGISKNILPATIAGIMLFAITLHWIWKFIKVLKR